MNCRTIEKRITKNVDKTLLSRSRFEDVEKRIDWEQIEASLKQSGDAKPTMIRPAVTFAAIMGIIAVGIGTGIAIQSNASTSRKTHRNGFIEGDYSLKAWECSFADFSSVRLTVSFTEIKDSKELMLYTGGKMFIARLSFLGAPLEGFEFSPHIYNNVANEYRGAASTEYGEANTVVQANGDAFESTVSLSFHVVGTLKSGSVTFASVQ